MAKVLFQAPVSGLRGKLGGSIYSANKSGPYLMARPAYIRQKSTAATVQQTTLTGEGKLWAALTPTQRLQWDTYAALAAQAQTDSLGATYYLSGWQWFVRVNLQLLKCWSYTNVVPPSWTPTVGLAPLIFYFTTNSTPGSDTRATFLNIYPPNVSLVFYGAVSNSVGRTVPVHSYVPFLYVPTGNASTESLHAAWTAKFGTPVIGQRGFIKACIQNFWGRRGALLGTYADCLT